MGDPSKLKPNWRAQVHSNLSCNPDSQKTIFQKDSRFQKTAPALFINFENKTQPKETLKDLECNS